MAFKFYIPIEKTIKIKPQQIYNYSLRFYCLNLYAIIYLWGLMLLYKR